MMKKESINPFKVIALFAMALGLVFITSCGDDTEVDNTPDPTENLMDMIRNTAGLDSLEKYLGAYPDLVGLLEGTGDMTVFAPNNTAFISLLATPGFPENILSINPEIVKGVLSYHVSTMRYASADLTEGTSIATAYAGQNISVNANGTLLTGSSNSEIEVVSADNLATNGVMHIVGSVLIPPVVGESLTPILGTNAGTILLGAPFSDLAAAISKADEFATTASIPTLTSILAGTTKHTVFAPTNETFAAGGLTTETFTGQQWYGIIANHVVMQEVTTDSLTDTEASTLGKTYRSALYLTPLQEYNALYFFNAGAANGVNGVGIFVDSNGDFDPAAAGSNFDAEIVVPDAVVNDNGRVHVIAGVLAPPQ